MQDNSQDRSMCFPKAPCQNLKLPLFLRVAGAGVVAFLMVAALNTTAFASSVPLKNSELPTMSTPQHVAGQQSAAQQTSVTATAITGVVIVAVDEEGPAAKAGIMRGDILLAAGEVAIDSAATLLGVVTSAKPGDQMVVVVQHGDEMRTVPVTLAQMGDRAYLGVQVVDPPVIHAMEVLPQVAAVPAVSGDTVTATVVVRQEGAGQEMVLSGPGLTVAEVVADGPAAQSGVVPGDLIMALDGRPVLIPEELLKMLQGHAPGDVVTLTVQKNGPVGGVIEDIPVTLGAAPDDPARAYLGLRVVALPPYTPSVTIEAVPAPGVYAAPALPEPIPSYGYGYSYGYGHGYGVPGGYAAPYPGAVCGMAGVTIEQNHYPPMQVAPLHMPMSPRVFAMPAMPAAPIFIYHHGDNPYGMKPTVYPYAASGTAEGNVIFFRAAPATTGGAAQHYEVAKPGMVVTKQGDVLQTWTATVNGSQGLPTWVEAQPVWTMGNPGTISAPIFGAVPGVVANEDVVVSQGTVKSFTVQVGPASGVWQGAPVAPAAGVHTFQFAPQTESVEAQSVEAEVNVDMWY